MGYLQTIVFILIIAILVQLLESILKKYIPALYKALGVYLPLITTNCTILGVTVLNIDNGYDFLESHHLRRRRRHWLSGGHGALLRRAPPGGAGGHPKCFKDLPITLVAAAMVSLSFMGFGGIVESIFGGIRGGESRMDMQMILMAVILVTVIGLIGPSSWWWPPSSCMCLWMSGWSRSPASWPGPTAAPAAVRAVPTTPRASWRTANAVNKCVPGGAACAAAIAQIMGVEAGSVTPMMAVVACSGTCEKTSKRYESPGHLQLSGGQGAVRRRRDVPVRLSGLWRLYPGLRLRPITSWTASPRWTTPSVPAVGPAPPCVPTR